MDFFDSAYRGGPPPWDIGRPQKEFVELVRRGEITGSVLDIGCGTGEHALFFACGIKCENHTVASWFLADVFGIESTDLESARKERLDKEYYVLAAPVRPEVEALIKTAESFNAVLLDKIERLTQQEIENYRIRFEKLLE